MEREKTIKWKKIGGGSFRLYNGKIVKKNEVFFAPLHLIPEAFRDTLQPVDKKEVEEVEKEIKTGHVSVVGKSHEYSIQPHTSKGWWNIVDGNGKVLNEKALRKPAAEEMLKNLEGIGE